jgi:hypothetical protein
MSLPSSVPAPQNVMLLVGQNGDVAISHRMQIGGRASGRAVHASGHCGSPCCDQSVLEDSDKRRLGKHMLARFALDIPTGRLFAELKPIC